MSATGVYDKASKFCLNRPSQSRLDMLNNFLFEPTKLSMFYVVTMFDQGNHLSLIDREKGLHGRRRFNCASSRKVSNYYTIYTGLFCFCNNFTLLQSKRSSKNYCSDFRYESNGIFVLGWVFFSSDKFRLFNQPFLTEFFNIIRKLLLS